MQSETYKLPKSITRFSNRKKGEKKSVPCPGSTAGEVHHRPRSISERRHSLGLLEAPYPPVSRAFTSRYFIAINVIF
ncbi:hypothetical protein BUE80_DR005029 [Diplocarpon rosae]|nr:hypothetical protein BUE80_DR005029 [Diplocarpon rosae]